MTWLALLAILLIVIGSVLLRGGKQSRQTRGLSQGNTLALDSRTLRSARHGLSGRPDRLFRDGAATIPEEWKKSSRVHDSHRAQVGAYFIMIEEETGVAPTYGVIVLGDGSRVTIRNTPELRTYVLDIAEQIRAARRELGEEIPVRQPPGKCRPCGMRDHCKQRSA